jgi:hypothetical protein
MNSNADLKNLYNLIDDATRSLVWIQRQSDAPICMAHALGAILQLLRQSIPEPETKANIFLQALRKEYFCRQLLQNMFPMLTSQTLTEGFLNIVNVLLISPEQQLLGLIQMYDVNLVEFSISAMKTFHSSLRIQALALETLYLALDILMRAVNRPQELMESCQESAEANSCHEFIVNAGAIARNFIAQVIDNDFPQHIPNLVAQFVQSGDLLRVHYAVYCKQIPLLSRLSCI